MSLYFHIIYTAGTVQPLLFLVHRLLRWSDCTFRLIANGCTRQEEQRLAAFCHDELRLSFVRLPTKHMMGHGQALNELQTQLDPETAYFCSTYVT